MTRIKKRPATEKGKELLRLCEELHGSLYRAARLADIHYATLRRRVFGVPRGVDNETILKLEGIGIPRNLLLP